MITRSLRVSTRQVDALITSVALPVIMMLMFVYLFGGAIRGAIPGGGDYVDYVVPGVLLMCVGWAAGTTAVSVAQDVTTGIIDRFRSLDVGGQSLTTGHVVASVARNLVGTTLVFGVAFAVGFRSSAGVASWLAAIGILILFIVALSWMAAAIGMVARSAEAASGMAFFISFLAYPSSAFVPIRTMPTWLRGFAENQPVTQVINAIRSLLDGTAVGSSAWRGVVWSLGILAVSVALAGYLFQRRTR
jgi:ABC-2 type transport system permease protein